MRWLRKRGIVWQCVLLGTGRGDSSSRVFSMLRGTMRPGNRMEYACPGMKRVSCLTSAADTNQSSPIDCLETDNMGLYRLMGN